MIYNKNSNSGNTLIGGH